MVVENSPWPMALNARPFLAAARSWKIVSDRSSEHPTAICPQNFTLSIGNYLSLRKKDPYELPMQYEI